MVTQVAKVIEYLPYGALALVAGLILLKSPFVGLVAMAILIPGEELTKFLGGHTLTWALGIATASAWALRTSILRQKVRIAWRPVVMASLWLIWALFSVFWAKDQKVALSGVVTLAQCIVFFFLIQALITSNRKLHLLLFFYFAAAVIYACIAIGLDMSENLRRVALAEGQNPNAFARTLGIALLMVPHLLRNSKRIKWRVAIMVGGCALAIAILLTGSRGTWVSIIVAFGFTLLLARRKVVQLRQVIVGMVGFTFLFAGLQFLGVIDEYLEQRILDITSLDTLLDAGNRMNIWMVGWEMVKDNPIIGVGFRNFPVRFEDYIGVAGLWGTPGIYPGRDPHSIFLGVQAELGIIGLLMFLMFFYFIFCNLLPYRGDSRGVLGILLLSFMVFSGIPEPILYRKYFWFALGLATLVPGVIRCEGFKSVGS